jgi:CO/xanthine dehydrogenase FAD-binding subunit
VKPAPFAYARPSTLDEALATLAGDPDAKVLAGGQSLVPLLSMRLAAPGLLVDINGLPGLSRIDCDARGVRFGALVRHAELLAHSGAREVQPLLAQALGLVAHGTIRNRGTTVGSLVHADPAAEMPMVLRLLGGQVTVASSSGTRDIGADELFAGPMESSLRPDELAVSAWVPALAPDAGVAIDEVARRHGDYALCGVGAVVGTEDGRITSVRAGYLSVCEVPTVVDVSEAFAAGDATDAALDAAAEIALADLEPADDIHGSAAYRTQLTRTLTRRVVRAAYDDARGRNT